MRRNYKYWEKYSAGLPEGVRLFTLEPECFDRDTVDDHRGVAVDGRQVARFDIESPWDDDTKFRIMWLEHEAMRPRVTEILRIAAENWVAHHKAKEEKRRAERQEQKRRDSDEMRDTWRKVFGEELPTEASIRTPDNPVLRALCKAQLTGAAPADKSASRDNFGWAMLICMGLAFLGALLIGEVAK